MKYEIEIKLDDGTNFLIIPEKIIQRS